MESRQLYKTMTFNKDFGFKEYITPHYQCDPKRQILARTYQDYKHRPKQGKLKITTKPKKCFFDEIVKLTEENPEPSKYNVSGNISKTYKSASLKKVDPKCTKKTYIDDMILFQAKHKPPGVGKFDLTKYTDLGTIKRYSSARIDREKQIIKHNNFDDTIKLAAALPGPGQFNPHITVKKIKVNRTDMQFWKEKHEQLQKKRSKTIETKRGPNTYEPIVANTFHSITALKKNERSRWSHGQIDIRKGYRSEMKEPSPCQYNTVHQWMKTGKKEVPIGNFSVLNRITSAGHLSVYH